MIRHPLGRGVGVAWLLLALTGAAAVAEVTQVRRQKVVVKETAGIRRFGYPVSVVLPLAGPVKDTEHFRLLDRDKPVPAQFRPHGDASKGIRSVHLDFNVNHAPLETRKYTVEYGPGVKPGPQSVGMKIVTDDDQFRVVYSPSLQFIVPRNLLGLIRGVKTPKSDYLRAGSAGLMMRSKDNSLFRAGGSGPSGKPLVARIVKHGPLASTLRFESMEALRNSRKVDSVVTLEFPLSKSWMQVKWTVDDPKGWVAGLGADLNLNIQGEPALVDFGAGSYVYAHLRKGQQAILRHHRAKSKHPAWETLVGPASSPTRYVVARPPKSGKFAAAVPTAEGWAHVMDRQRCTAVAVADFANPKEEAEIAIDANGRVRLWKHFATKGEQLPAGRKTIVFWLHFVDMPVQVGAVTSPQAMLAPLQVEVHRNFH